MRTIRLLARPSALVGCLVAVAVAVGGCGTERPEPTIQLRITTPLDGTSVTDGSITVAGSVSPVGTTVLVLGRSVPVRRGSFSTTVPLSPGSNLVDVLAGADRARAAMTAVRVYRQVLVTIPNVDSDSPADAAKALEALGLHTRIHNTDSLFDFLIPTSPAVCGTVPAANHRVLPGATVTITIAKTC
jgi:Glucodextranase, domain B/PASTA domain